MGDPVGFSNSNAGPPPGDFDTLSVTAQISSLGSTGSAIRASSRSFSSALMKLARSFISNYRWPRPERRSHRFALYRLHFVCDRLRKLQRAQAVGSADKRLTLVAHRTDEVLQL